MEKRKIKISSIPQDSRPKKTLTATEFRSVLSNLDSGEFVPFKYVYSHKKSRSKKQGNHVIAKYHRTNANVVYPICLVDSKNNKCSVFYLSNEQYKQYLSVEASIQRRVKPVKPNKSTSSNSEKQEKTEGGNK